MSDMRLGAWAFLGLGVMASTVACVDGSASSNQGPAESMSLGGLNSVGSPSGAGAGGKGNASAAGGAGVPIANCTAPQASCNGVCTDLTSVAHCGTCEQACVTGQSCTAGACVCPAAQVTCNGACVDTQTSVEHCGGCSKPCATGAACNAGVCGCAQGQELCNGVCVDLKQNEANCGMCGNACMTGGTCENGACVTGAGADGCTGGTALGITLKKIDVYQTVKVPVMDAGAEITTDKRTTDVVTGRVTMFRISVALGSGSSARQISARINVDNGTATAQYFAKQAVSKDSVETEVASTFQVVTRPSWSNVRPAPVKRAVRVSPRRAISHSLRVTPAASRSRLSPCKRTTRCLIPQRPRSPPTANS
jgi:Stigma-specific protein, Stig1